MNFLFSHFPYTILIVLLTSAFFCRKKSCLYPFDKSNTLAARGWMAVTIIIVHTAFLYPEVVIIRPFQSLGAPIVDVFFFFSGYGLIKSYYAKGNGFLHRFVTRNTLKLAIPLVIVTLIDQIIKLAYCGNITYRFSEFLNQGEPPLQYSWFIYALWVLYMSFYVIAKTPLGKKKESLVIGLFLINILYVFILRYIGWGVFWNLSLFAFNVGIVVAAWEKQLKTLYTNHPALLIIIAIVIYSAMVMANLRTVYQAFIPLGLYIFIITCGSVQDPFSKFLGNHSFEIYLCHGIFVPMAKILNFHWIIALIFAICACILSSIPVKLLSDAILKPIYKKLNLKDNYIDPKLENHEVEANSY